MPGVLDVHTLDDGGQPPEATAERLVDWLGAASRTLDLALYDVRLPGPVGDAVAESILATLVRLNSEFANYVPAARQRPRITLWPTGHPEYFPVGVKHRYSRR